MGSWCLREPYVASDGLHSVQPYRVNRGSDAADDHFLCSRGNSMDYLENKKQKRVTNRPSGERVANRTSGRPGRGRGQQGRIDVHVAANWGRTVRYAIRLPKRQVCGRRVAAAATAVISCSQRASYGGGH